MKTNKILILLAGVFTCLGLINANQLEVSSDTSVTENQPAKIRTGVQKASSLDTYTFPTDWQNKFLLGNLAPDSDHSAKCGYYIGLNYVGKIGFFDSWNKAESWFGTNTTTFCFEQRSTLYYTYDIMVAMNLSSFSTTKTNYPSIIAFWTYGVTIKAPTSACFSGFSATSYQFDNFEFSSYDQYQTVMTGTSSDANVSGTDVPSKTYSSLTEWKEALDTATKSTNYYKNVTSISFETDSSKLTGYTSMGTKIGDITIYRNGTDIIFYSSSSITAPTDMSSMFKDCTSLKSIDLSNLDASSVTNFSNIFTSDTKLETIVAPSSIGESSSIPLPSTYYDSKAEKDITAITSANAGHTLALHASHTMTKHDAVAATCTDNGVEAYYQCEVCKKIFSDAEGTKELTSIPYTSKLGHKLKEEKITLSSSKDSATITLTCERDGASLGTVNSTSVTPGSKVEPTCTEDGSQEYTIKYTFEDTEYTTTYTETLKKTGHTYEYVPTVDEDANPLTATVDVRCTKEDKTLKTVNASSVTLKESEDATHFKDGKKVYSITFEYDGVTKTIEKEVVVPKNEETLTYTCELDSNDKTKGTITITNEDGTFEEVVNATVTEKVTQESTCTVPGKVTYTFEATFEGETITKTLEQELPLKDHDLEYETEIIDEDHANVKENCKNEGGKTIKEDSNIAITKTTGGEGNATYSITLDNGTTLDVTAKVNEYLKNEEIKKEISSIKEAATSYTVNEVKDTDKTGINNLLTRIGAVFTNYEDDLTTTQKGELNSIKENLNNCLSKITDVESKIDSIDTALDGKTESNVKSSDKSSINGALNDINSLLDSSNITSDERTSLTTKKTEAEKLIAKITSVENKINEVKETLAKTDVTQAEKKSALEEARELIASSNLTSDESSLLTSLIGDTKDADVSSIKNASSSYNTSTVNSSNKEDINSLITKIDNTLTNYPSELTAEEKSELNSIKENLNSCISKITETTNEITSVNSTLDGKTENNVKSTDKSSINSVITDIDNLLASNNLTSEERTSLTSKKAEAEKLLSKISSVENDISSINSSLTGKETSKVKSSDKESLTETATKIDSLLASSNITEEEKASLTASKNNVTELLAKIAFVENEISSINSALDGKEENNVKSSDKTSINDAAEDIDELLSSENITEEERTSLTAGKGKAARLLAKISSTEESINEVKETLSNQNATEEEKNAAITKAQELIDSGNLTADEVAALRSLIGADDNNAQESSFNLIWLIITLSVIILIELLIIAHKKAKDKKNGVQAHVSIIPLAFLAIASGLMSQIIACVVLGIIAILLAIYISLLYIDWDWYKKVNQKRNK